MYPKGKQIQPKMSLFLFLMVNFLLHSFNSKRILELQQIGLINYWDTWFRPMPPQCDGKPKSGKKKKLSPLSMKNLTGAFIILLVGFSLSLLAFLGERIISITERKRMKTNEITLPSKIKAEEEPNKFILE